MALTVKQEKFAQAVVNGKTQADAYRESYKADNMSDAAIYNEAYLLAKNHDVSLRIEELRAEIAKECLWTREDSVKQLKKVLADGGGVAVSAVKELNAMHGFNAPIKHDIAINYADELTKLHEAAKRAKEYVAD